MVLHLCCRPSYVQPGHLFKGNARLTREEWRSKYSNPVNNMEEAAANPGEQGTRQLLAQLQRDGHPDLRYGINRQNALREGTAVLWGSPGEGGGQKPPSQREYPHQGGLRRAGTARLCPVCGYGQVRYAAKGGTREYAAALLPVWRPEPGYAVLRVKIEGPQQAHGTMMQTFGAPGT